MFGEGLELERVKGVFTTSHILHGVLSPAALTAHTVQGLVEDLWGEGVLLLQDLTLLQGQGHGCAVLGALTTGETHSIQAATCLGCPPQNLHVLAFLGVHILAQMFQQLGKTGGTAGRRQAVVWQDFFKLVVVGAEASHALHVDHIL